MDFKKLNQDLNEIEVMMVDSISYGSDPAIFNAVQGIVRVLFDMSAALEKMAIDEVVG